MSAGPNNPPRADSERFQFSVIGLFGITTIAAVLAWAALQFRILPDVVRVLVLTVVLAGGVMVCNKPVARPSGVVTSTSNCVGSVVARVVVRVMSARITSSSRALYRSDWTTRAGRTFDPLRSVNGKSARMMSPRL